MINEPPALTIRDNFRRPTREQVAAFRGVQTGFICDAMEGQGALDYRIQHVGQGRDLPDHAVGTAIVADNGPSGILARLAALHILQPGDIVVASVSGAENCAAAGDQICGMLRNKGAAGFVTDGQMRDYVGIVAAGLPAWCAGLSPNSPYVRGPARTGFGAVVGGRYVESGDIIVADRDGVVVVPFARIDEVIAHVSEVAAHEAELEARVKAGFWQMPVVAEMIADGRAVIDNQGSVENGRKQD